MKTATEKTSGRFSTLRTWASRESATLIILMLTAASIWGFVAVADEVREGDSRRIDRQLLLALRTPGDTSDPLGARWVEEMARDITGLGGVGILTGLSIGACGYLWMRGQREMFWLMAGAAGGAILLSLSLKYAFDRPRPDLVPHGSYVYTRSFPSGHSMMAAAIYLTIGAILSRVEPRRALRFYLFSICVVVTLLVGVSRVYLGVHWPTDVLAGWAAGAAWAAICYLLAGWLRRLAARRRSSRSSMRPQNAPAP